MAGTYDTFARFSTDAYGLERLFRLLQSVVQILAAYPLLLSAVIALLSSAAASFPANQAGKDEGGDIDGDVNPEVTVAAAAATLATALAVLAQLKHRLALVRRCLRLFRFLDSFKGAQDKFSSSSSSSSSGGRNLSARDWLDVLGKTFNGLYYLLEASTVVEAAGIEGLPSPWAAVMGQEGYAAKVNVEAQRFWLFALVCGVGGGVCGMWGLSGMGSAATTAAAAAAAVAGGQKEEDDEKEKTTKARAAALAVAAEKEKQAKMAVLRRGTLASALDLILAGSAVGWLDVEPGTVGVAQLVTSVLTSVDVWARCAKEVA